MAHAAAIGIHVLCCGLPVAASLVSLATGLALTGALAPIEALHGFLHQHEWTLVGISGAFVLLGVLWDRHERAHGHRGAGIWLWVSAGLFALNLGLTTLHHSGLWPPGGHAHHDHAHAGHARAGHAHDAPASAAATSGAPAPAAGKDAAAAHDHAHDHSHAH